MLQENFKMSVGGSHGRLPHDPPAEIDAEEMKRTGERTWRPERVALVADISEDAVYFPLCMNKLDVPMPRADLVGVTDLWG
jgi:hypothetical protein